MLIFVLTSIPGRDFSFTSSTDTCSTAQPRACIFLADGEFYSGTFSYTRTAGIPTFQRAVQAGWKSGFYRKIRFIRMISLFISAEYLSNNSEAGAGKKLSDA